MFITRQFSSTPKVEVMEKGDSFELLGVIFLCSSFFFLKLNILDFKSILTILQFMSICNLSTSMSDTNIPLKS